MPINDRFRPRGEALLSSASVPPKKEMTFSEMMEARAAEEAPHPFKVSDEKNITTKISEKEVLSSIELQPKDKVEAKEQISIRLSLEVLHYFQFDGPGWTGRINDVLLDYVREHRRVV